MALEKGKAAAPGKAPSGGYQVLVIEALLALKETSGSSLQAITKYIGIQRPDIPADKLRTQVKLTLKRMLDKDTLRKIKASYKLTPQAAAAAKKPPTKKKVPVKKPVKKSPSSSSATKPKPRTEKKSSSTTSKQSTKAKSSAKPKKTIVKKKATTKKVTSKATSKPAVSKK